MHPAQTIYRLATTGQDFKRCHALLRTSGRAEGQEHLTTPVVMAERAGRLLGFVSTSLQHKVVAVGRFIVAPGPHVAFVALRLGEAYERVLGLCHITEYFFAVEDDNGTLCTLVERLGIPVWQTVEGAKWYKRQVPTTEGT